MITKAEIDAMSPEELDEFRREASIAVVKRMVWMLAFKIALHIFIRRLTKRLAE